MLNQSNPFFRFLSLVTLLTFFPSSVAVWNFIPPIQQVASAEEAAGDSSPASSQGAPDAEQPLILAQLSREELEQAGTQPAGRVKIAQAALPNVAELLATTSTATQGAIATAHSARDLEGVYAPHGPVEAATGLDNADALMATGRTEDACAAYILIIDRFPGTYEALRASNGLTKLAEGIRYGSLSTSETDAVDAYLPAWESLSAPGKYAIQDWYWMRAEAAFKAGDEQALASSCAKHWEASRRFLAEHRDHYLALAVALELYDSQDWASKHGLTTHVGAVAELEAIANSDTPGLARLGAHCALTNYTWKEQHDRGATIIHNANILSELEYGYVDEVLDDPYVYYWIKSLIGTAVGTALETMGRLQDALDWYQNPAFHIRERGLTTIIIDYDVARIKQLMEPQNPTVAIEAFQEFINAHPDSEQVPMARLEFGNIFMTAGDYDGAVALYRDVVKNYPETEAALLAEDALNFIGTYLYGTVEVADGRLVNQQEADTALAMLCGPRALQRLLVDRGVPATVEELAQLAGTDETGTTMQGLIQAADGKGVKLVGVEAPEPQQLDTPFIAYVNGNHYLLVTEVTPHLLAVSDQGEDPVSMDFAEFARRWDGKALVLGDAPRIARLLEAQTLESVKGGNGGGSGAPVPPDPPKCEDEKCGCPEDNGDGNPPDPPKVPHRVCNTNGCTPGSPKCPSAESGAHSPGVNPVLYPSSTTFKLDETDVSIRVRGQNSLTFGRTLINEKGYHRPRFTDSTKPWSNILGKGWTHRFNMHLVTSTPVSGRPDTVVFYDEKGTERTYSYSSTAGTFYYYLRSSTGSSGERGYLLILDSSTGKYYLSMPGGRQYHFSAATNGAERFARLEKVFDMSANELTLDYDGAVGTGKLTKVSPPSGDTRYLQLSYSGNLITKVELMKSGNEFQTIQYAYNASNELTKVTDDASRDVVYAYATYASAPTSRFLTKITNKAGRDTDFTYTFGYSSGYQATKVHLDNAAGLRTTYDRNISTGVAAVTNTVSVR